ncbi:MAG TPA: HEAT repeat domain-containing protein, partial [Pirellulaceae bacterium]|nr:HEAT repeat domain-containing protein [Pirellulaceae bacterium]
CNYTGNGGIESFAVVPQGAGFEIVDAHDFFKPIQATDMDFGYDGKVYVSDFVKLEWNGGGGWGRIYTLHDTESIKHASVKETTERFRAGFTKLTAVELAALLSHADMRMRLRAQYELAKRATATPMDRAALEALKSATQASNSVLCRLHGIWGLGQIAAQDATICAAVANLLHDENEHVRGQAAKVLGDGAYQPAAAELIALLTDTNPRVQFLAAMALGKLKSKSSLEPIIALLRSNADRDPLLRHAGVMALLQLDDLDQLLKYSSDPAPAVRMAVVLVLRRQADPRIAEFLNDEDPRIVTEAARAINDLPIDAAMPALASLTNRYQLTPQSVPQPLLRRIINANFRGGKREHADALVAIVANERVEMSMRLEALAALKEWSQPGKRDCVTGFWRPTAARSPEILQASVQSGVTQMLTTASGDLQTQLTELIALVKVDIDDQTIAAWTSDPQRPIAARVAALRLLTARGSGSLPSAIEKALADKDGRVRAAARQALARVNVDQAVKSIHDVLQSDAAPAIEKQLAIETVAAIGTPI